MNFFLFSFGLFLLPTVFGEEGVFHQVDHTGSEDEELVRQARGAGGTTGASKAVDKHGIKNGYKYRSCTITLCNYLLSIPDGIYLILFLLFFLHRLGLNGSGRRLALVVFYSTVGCLCHVHLYSISLQLARP